MAHEAHKCEIVIQVRDLVTGEIRQYDIPQAANLTWDEDHELEDLDFRSVVIVNRMLPPKIRVSFRPGLRKDADYYMLVRDLGVSTESICELP